MAYDPATKDVVLFGGGGQVGLLDDTWIFNGSDWSEVSAVGEPPGLASASMAYDPAIKDVVLFGGADGSQMDSDATWTFNGSTWREVFPAASPPARDGASMAYDAATGKLVLFGGVALGIQSRLLDDTWTFNGTTWEEVSPSTSPPAREGASMAYDPTVGKVVLFGGYAGLGSASSSEHHLHDTWTFNGTIWKEVFPAASPPGRFSASMAYDSATSGIVLFGGSEASTSIPPHYLDDTWTFNGTTWKEARPATSPPGRWNASMAYDPATKDIVLFGGGGTTTPLLNDTWTWGKR